RRCHCRVDIWHAAGSVYGAATIRAARGLYGCLPNAATRPLASRPGFLRFPADAVCSDRPAGRITMLTVSSDRLLLMACSAQVARAAFNGRRHAEVLIRYRVHPDWPSAEIHGYLPVYARQVENDPALIGWGVWMIIHVADQVVIGDVG